MEVKRSDKAVELIVEALGRAAEATSRAADGPPYDSVYELLAEALGGCAVHHVVMYDGAADDVDDADVWDAEVGRFEDGLAAGAALAEAGVETVYTASLDEDDHALLQGQRWQFWFSADSEQELLDALRASAESYCVGACAEDSMSKTETACHHTVTRRTRLRQYAGRYVDMLPPACPSALGHLTHDEVCCGCGAVRAVHENDPHVEHEEWVQDPPRLGRIFLGLPREDQRTLHDLVSTITARALGKA